MPTVKAASLPLLNHLACILGLGTRRHLRGGDLARPLLPPVPWVSRWGLLGTGLQGSLVSKLAHLRSNSLFIIDLLHDTQEKTAITLFVQANQFSSLMPCCQSKRKNTPNLLPELKLHQCKSHWEILQALKTLSWSSTIYFPFEYFLTCLLQ